MGRRSRLPRPLGREAPPETVAQAEEAAGRVPSLWPRGRTSVPEDRDALANGCYAIYADGAAAYPTRAGEGFAVTAPTLEEAEPFLQLALGATLLGRSTADRSPGASR
jgi:hypothetical protein